MGLRLCIFCGILSLCFIVFIVLAALTFDTYPNPVWDHPARGNPAFDHNAPQRFDR